MKLLWQDIFLTKGGEVVRIPMHWTLCPYCHGEGSETYFIDDYDGKILGRVSVLSPNKWKNLEEFQEWDETLLNDLRQKSFPCEKCNGAGRRHIVDENKFFDTMPEIFADYVAYLEREKYEDELSAMELRYLV